MMIWVGRTFSKGYDAGEFPDDLEVRFVMHLTSAIVISDIVRLTPRPTVRSSPGVRPFDSPDCPLLRKWRANRQTARRLASQSRDSIRSFVV